MSNLLFVDSHCHLDQVDLSNFQGEIHQMLSEAHHQQVGYFLNVGIHPDTIPTLQAMARNHSNMSISIGLHPTESIEKEPTIEQLVHWASDPTVVAIGETGLDYTRDTDRSTQQQRFRNHIRAAKQVNKPLIIHTRGAIADTLEILKAEAAYQVGGVLHCFTETLEMATTAIESLGFYISFSGILTFKNASSLRDIARQLPLDRLLIETDSPYLTPEPFRGKQPNYPGHVVYVAQTLATLHNTTVEKIGEHTTNNFFELFKGAIRPKGL